MRRLRLSLITILYSLAVFIVPLFGAKTAFADFEDTVQIMTRPPLVSASNTATFVSMSGTFQPMECKLDDEDIALCGTYQSVTYQSLAEGEHTFTVHVAGATNPESTTTYTWTVARPPELTGSATFYGAPGEPIAVTDLQVNDSGNDTRTVQLHVTSGTLQMATTTGLSFATPTSGATLLFQGARSNLNTALASLTYTPTGLGTVTLHASISGEEGQEDGIIDNRAFRVLHSDDGVTWAQAKAAAEASSLGGLTGHLAAITSAEVNNFVNLYMTGGVWIGGTDAGNEGEWKWVGGAHDGEVFWNGAADGSAPDGMYAHWNGSMPDNYNNNENCAESGANIATPTWNDRDCDNLQSDYIVEYGDGVVVPDISTKDISLISSADTDNDGVPNAEENAGPNDGDANNDSTPDAQQANVASYLNSVTGRYQVVTTDCDSLTGIQTGAETSGEHADPAYNYPAGLTYFHASCQQGATGHFTQYFYGVNGNDTFVMRKWGTDYETMAGAVFTGEIIGQDLVFRVDYDITDGQQYDEDGEANGTIVDPAGPATPVGVVQAPNTGLGR